MGREGPGRAPVHACSLAATASGRWKESISADRHLLRERPADRGGEVRSASPARPPSLPRRLDRPSLVNHALRHPAASTPRRQDTAAAGAGLGGTGSRAGRGGGGRAGEGGGTARKLVGGGEMVEAEARVGEARVAWFFGVGAGGKQSGGDGASVRVVRASARNWRRWESRFADPGWHGVGWDGASAWRGGCGPGSYR